METILQTLVSGGVGRAKESSDALCKSPCVHWRTHNTGWSQFAQLLPASWQCQGQVLGQAHCSSANNTPALVRGLQAHSLQGHLPGTTAEAPKCPLDLQKPTAPVQKRAKCTSCVLQTEVNHRSGSKHAQNTLQVLHEEENEQKMQLTFSWRAIQAGRLDSLRGAQRRNPTSKSASLRETWCRGLSTGLWRSSICRARGWNCRSSFCTHIKQNSAACTEIMCKYKGRCIFYNLQTNWRAFSQAPLATAVS